MLGSELKTFKKPDLEHLKSGIDEILEPFCSLANFDYIDFDSGREAVEYLDKTNENFGMVPPSVVGIIRESPTCILQQFGYKNVLWFFAKAKKRTKGYTLWVIRRWEFISAEYTLNEQGHIFDPKFAALLAEKTGKALDITSGCITKQYTPKDLEDILQSGIGTVYAHLIRNGIIPSYKQGSQANAPVFISEYWLNEYKQHLYWQRLNKTQPLERYSHAFGNWEDFDE